MGPQLGSLIPCAETERHKNVDPPQDSDLTKKADLEVKATSYILLNSDLSQDGCPGLPGRHLVYLETQNKKVQSIASVHAALPAAVRWSHGISVH